MDIIDIFKNCQSPTNNMQYKGYILLGGFAIFAVAWLNWSSSEESKQENTVE